MMIGSFSTTHLLYLIMSIGWTLVLSLLNRFPVLVVAGAALLGWVAGEIGASDPALEHWFAPLPRALELWAAGGGAALLLLVAGGRRLLRPAPA